MTGFISVEDFQHTLQTNGDAYQLIDVREAIELRLANLNHLGFRHYPLSEFEAWHEQILKDLQPDRPTYVLCHHGIRSAQVAEWLRQQGFHPVINISGGIQAWSERVDPAIPTY
ncbi:MAG: rhodanese-like domain-containing protein [Cyanobacteriota bacterium]|nr:rhodanese-like domain-containing protein [Cyanobacteriota bacterium]